ncbi:FUSC family protein [Ktedonospora formicarum]|uniref:Integral membrane bound transporter domain-containing protein n=1 Tax=Ktedonospora formicarum TaxID=2778364 RepID=A0A8J3HYY8_9CHLR|nr:FUSC family protein [Ktedonospora formicarum]GHO46802.1 hypothetical protein KSX_49650 [Ktedonospora formicarum]
MRTLPWTIQHNLKWRKAGLLGLAALQKTLAAAVSWQVAFLLAGTEAAALAAVSAVIVLQVTGWQTIQKSIERVLGVIIGISISIGIVHYLGLQVWTIFCVVFAASIIGICIQKQGAYMATQIPISALLGLVVGVGEESYPLLRLLGALIGGVIGIAFSILLSPPTYAHKAQKTLANLLQEVAQTLPTLADTVAGSVASSRQLAIYEHMHAVERKVRASERDLALGRENLRFNPWGRSLQGIVEGQPHMLEMLEKLTRQMERIAWTVSETGNSWEEMCTFYAWAKRYAELLRIMGEMLDFVGKRVQQVSLTTSGMNYKLEIHDENRVLAQLEQAQKRLTEEEAALLKDREETSVKQQAKPESTHPSYRVVVRSSLLLDLGRMLDDLEEMITTVRRWQAGGVSGQFLS